MKGMPLTGLTGLTPDQIEAGLGGLPAASKHAAVLASDALQQLLAQLL